VVPASAPPTNLTALTTALATTAAPKAKGAKLPAKQTAPQAPDEETSQAPANEEATQKSGSKTLLAGSDLSVMLARAAMLAANARSTSATTTASATSATATSDAAEAASAEVSDDLPVLAGNTKPAVAPITEKKSGATNPGRSFIQPDTSSASTLGMAFVASAASIPLNSHSSTNQQLTTSTAPSKNGLAGAPADPLAAAGMASGKKENEMNATLELTDLMASTGTTPVVNRSSADVNILLGTNNDFKDALTQVMHVAEYSNLSTTTPPLRVAIEIQTPPGAVVNLYVSKQPDDTYRAQLSTDDLQALSWVQNQIGSLKESTATGVEVRWMPAQLETISAPTTSSTADSGLNWNRGGQGQGWQSSQQQQADERQQSPRQKRGYASVLEPELSIPFIGALGRAA
jgi:hypothetical protein